MYPLLDASRETISKRIGEQIPLLSLHLSMHNHSCSCSVVGVGKDPTMHSQSLLRTTSTSGRDLLQMSQENFCDTMNMGNFNNLFSFLYAR
jgi:hypothetical protein